MCFKFIPQPNPPVFLALKEYDFFPTAPWAISLTEQSLLQCSVNLIMFISTEPSFSLSSIPGKCDSVYKSFAVSTLDPCTSYTQVGGLFLRQRQSSECRAPSQINRLTIALLQGLQGTRERKELPDTWVHLYFPLGYDDQPENILLRDGWDRVCFKWLLKDNAVIAYLRELPAVQRKRSHFLKCDSKA